MVDPKFMIDLGKSPYSIRNISMLDPEKTAWSISEKKFHGRSRKNWIQKKIHH